MIALQLRTISFTDETRGGAWAGIQIHALPVGESAHFHDQLQQPVLTKKAKGVIIPM